MDWITMVKAFIISAVMQVIAYLKPLGDEMFILFMIFSLNFLIGYLTDILVNNKEFSFKKFRWFLLEAGLFFGLAASIFSFGEHKGWEAGSVQCVSSFTYLISYAYVLRILRNLKQIFRTHTAPYTVFNTLYYFLSIEFLRFIPYIGSYVNLSEDEFKERQQQAKEEFKNSMNCQVPFEKNCDEQESPDGCNENEFKVSEEDEN